MRAQVSRTSLLTFIFTDGGRSVAYLPARVEGLDHLGLLVDHGKLARTLPRGRRCLGVGAGLRAVR